MITLRNNTGATSKVGFAVTLDSVDRNSFVYAPFGSTKIIGVVAEAVPYRKLCKIATQGDKAQVYVTGNVVKDNIIRLAKSTDRASLGSSVIAKSGDAPYLKVGDALNSGGGLIPMVLDLLYVATESTGSFQPLDADLTRLADYRRIGGDTNYTQFDADGSVSFVGDATVWDDLRIVPNVFDVPGGTDPDVISYQPAGSGATFKVYGFAKGDEGFFTCQLPHGYKEGSTLKAHIHWTPGARGVAESGHTVQWRLDYSIAPIGGNFPASQTLNLADVCDGVDHKHQMTAEVDISGAGLTISSQMWGRVYRLNDPSDTWVGTLANLPIFIEFDIHVEHDTVGSRDSSDK